MRLPKPVFACVAAMLAASVAISGCSKKSGTTGSSSGGAKKLTIAFVPKLQGIPYFEAMNTGGQQAAKDLGVQWIYKGATTADPGAQTDIVKSLIQQHVDVLVVAPNDPDSMAPILQDAKNQGIHVMTADTDAPNSVRELFVNQATAQGLGQSITDALMKKIGPKGKYAIVSCGQTAANLNSWIAVQKQYTAQKYPGAKIVGTVYAGEDEAKATSMAKDLINAHPDLNGLVGECTSSAPAVAKAVEETGKVGKIFTVGVGTPQSMKPYLKDGSSSAAILWDVQQLGYLTAWAADQIGTGKQLQPVNKVNAQLPAVKYFPQQKMLLLGEPLQITTANVDNYNY